MTAVVAVVVLTAVVAVVVLGPLFRPDAMQAERVANALSREQDLHTRHAMALAALRDLEDDRATGKIGDADYVALRARLEGTRRFAHEEPRRSAGRAALGARLEDEILVAARGLTRRFGATTALDGVDLTVRRGEPLALFGANGAGKTTLLRLLSGGAKPTSGTLSIDGVDPRRAPAKARGRIGLVSHHTLLYDDLSALENLVFFARLHGLPDPTGRSTTLLEEVGLLDRAHEPVSGFSRGMQQRVALARALLHDPSLLLLDEPFSGLDARASDRLRHTLHEAAARGATWVMATHDVEIGLDLCPRWIALDRGRVKDGGASAGQPAVRINELVLGSA
jgi:heme ABC exporter ATP-binding subunit CcmA